MTKSLFLIISLFLLLNIFDAAQRVDIPPNGKQNYRAVEGGSVKVNIDQTTPIEKLIEKLDSSWQFVETGKFYWIGYTDDMYSIAAYKDSAITPLVNHFYSTKSKIGKIGVICSLHLIGIESEIAGRFTEKFKNKKAREALLMLANQEEYTGTIVSLLGRDPWKSDLPILIELLKKNNNCLELVNALFRYIGMPYENNGLPFRQDIPKDMDTINVFVQDSLGIFRIGSLIRVSGNEASKAENKGALNKSGIIVQFGGEVRVFWKFVFNNGETKKILSYFNCNQKELTNSSCKELNEMLYDLILLSWEKIGSFSYCDYWDPFQHYVQENNLVICTPEQSAKRWLEYLKNRNLFDK